MNVINASNVVIFNVETGERIAEAEGISASIEKENIPASIKFSHEPIDIRITNIHASGKTLAFLVELDRNPKIERLIKFYDKASKKRIKKKLDKRILVELGKLA